MPSDSYIIVLLPAKESRWMLTMDVDRTRPAETLISTAVPFDPLLPHTARDGMMKAAGHQLI
jgi:hypothetical protein